MQKLIKLVSNVLNITFVEGVASKAGVSFATNSYNGKDSISVFSDKYTNIYGRISTGMPTKAIKDIANNMATIDSIGSQVKTKMKDYNLTPYGNWFVTSKAVMTVVTRGGQFFDFIYYTDGREHELYPREREAKKGIPQLRKPIVKPIEFDRGRFNKYVQLVADYRKYYKVSAEKLMKAELNERAKQQLDLNDPKKVLHDIIDTVRKLNGKEYKASIETEVDAIINKVNKIKEERKEAAKAASTPQFDRLSYYKMLRDSYYKANK